MLDVSIDSINLYFLFATFQGVILALLIIFTRSLVKPNAYFALLLFLFSISLLHAVLESSIHAFNIKCPIPMDFSLTYGPLAYLHIIHIKNPSRKFKATDLKHFLPSVLFDIIFFSGFFIYLGEHREWANNHIAAIQTFALSISLICLIQFSIYTYFIYRESTNTIFLLKEYSKVREWLNILVFSWIAIITILLIALPISIFYVDYLDDNSSLLYNSVGLVIMFWIFIIGFVYLIKYAAVIESYMNKVSRLTLTYTELIQKKEELLNVLEQKELYKDSKLTISKLAEELDWPINSLSTIINEQLQITFNDLISNYRIAAFKQKIIQGEQEKFSVLGIAQAVGFSSKASFYRIFKKVTGMTPTEFIKSHS